MTWSRAPTLSALAEMQEEEEEDRRRRARSCTGLRTVFGERPPGQEKEDGRKDRARADAGPHAGRVLEAEKVNNVGAVLAERDAARVAELVLHQGGPAVPQPVAMDIPDPAAGNVGVRDEVTREKEVDRHVPVIARAEHKERQERARGGARVARTREEERASRRRAMRRITHLDPQTCFEP